MYKYEYKYKYRCKYVYIYIIYIYLYTNKYQGISVSTGIAPSVFPGMKRDVETRFAPRKLNQKVQQNQQKWSNLWAYIGENFRKSGFTIPQTIHVWYIYLHLP